MCRAMSRSQSGEGLPGKMNGPASAEAREGATELQVKTVPQPASQALDPGFGTRMGLQSFLN